VNAALLLRVIEDGLRPAVVAAGGVLDVASDPGHVVELLTGAAPNGWRCVLGYAGERALDLDDARGIRELELTTTVQAARGLAVKSGANAHRVTRANRDSLLDLSNQVDLWMRGFTGTTYGDIEEEFRFVSRQWIEIEGHPLRQVMTTHAIRVANDPVEDDDKLTLTFPAPPP
jgi:hypothetical protein